MTFGVCSVCCTLFLLWARWFFVEVRFPQSSTNSKFSIKEMENINMYS
nr:MAG TPA: hypothetical protein [Bacteriophage sp.]